MVEKGYIALTQQHIAALYRAAYSIVSNRADAVQQCLPNAWRMREKAWVGTERAWMMRIVINECCTILRSRKQYAPGQIPEGICLLPEDTGLRDAASPSEIAAHALSAQIHGGHEGKRAGGIHGGCLPLL